MCTVISMGILGALADLSGDLEAAGIDTSDWAPLALQGVTYEGGIYGVLMDFHANLFHVNMDLMAEGGLVEDGRPILPTSPEELLAQATQFREATGQNFLAADFVQFPIGVRLVASMLWQQGANIFDDEGNATIDTPEARAAIASIVQLFDNGLAEAKPIFDELENWLHSQLPSISGKSPLAGAIRYALTRMARLQPYLDHGILELDNNTAERAMRSVVPSRQIASLSPAGQ